MEIPILISYIQARLKKLLFFHAIYFKLYPSKYLGIIFTVFSILTPSDYSLT